MPNGIIRATARVLTPAEASGMHGNNGWQQVPPNNQGGQGNGPQFTIGQILILLFRALRESYGAFRLIIDLMVKWPIILTVLFGLLAPIGVEYFTGDFHWATLVTGAASVLFTTLLVAFRGGLLIDIPLITMAAGKKLPKHIDPLRYYLITIVVQISSAVYFFLVRDWLYMNLAVALLLLAFWYSTILAGVQVIDWKKYAYWFLLPIAACMVIALVTHAIYLANHPELDPRSAKYISPAKADSIAKLQNELTAAQRAAQARSSAQYDSIVHRVGPAMPKSYEPAEAINGSTDVNDPDGQDFTITLEPHDKLVITPDMSKEWYWVSTSPHDLDEPEYSARVNACGTGYTPSTMHDVTQRGFYPDQAARMGSLITTVGGDKYGFECRPGVAVQSDTITNQGGKVTSVKVQINTNRTLGGRSGNALFTLQRLKAVY